MAVSIDVVQEHGLGKREAKERMAERAAHLESANPSWGIRGTWIESNVYSFKGTAGAAYGVSGTITVKDDRVKIELSLPDEFAVFADGIREDTQRKLAKALQ